VNARFSVLLPLALLACAKGPAKEKGSARDCFAYTMPAGWHVEPSKTGADLVLTGPTKFPVADKVMSDNFIIRFLPYPGTLASFKSMFLAQFNQAGIDKAIAEHAGDNPALPALKSGVPKPTITETKLGGREAFRVDVTNTLMMGAAPVPMKVSTVFAKFGDEVVSINLGYVDSREAEVAPLQEPFLAAVNFDRCK
jgi:hypothetical protein